MNAMQVRRSAGEAETSPDPSWRGLYRAEGISAVAQHTAFATAAEVFIAGNNITYAVGLLAPVGILILSLVMLKGVFPKALRIRVSRRASWASSVRLFGPSSALATTSMGCSCRPGFSWLAGNSAGWLKTIVSSKRNRRYPS